MKTFFCFIALMLATASPSVINEQGKVDKERLAKAITSGLIHGAKTVNVFVGNQRTQ
ncbi:MAG: hypothetical protein GJ680_18425 [Alteromonadaceae bacterium]|nr:hypothetical protein [Alteromonadaceae bacterium]